MPKTDVKNLIPFGIRFFILSEVAMDIYIVRKCRVEIKEFSGASGAKYKLPVMTGEDIHSYVFQERLTPEQRDKIQKDLENYYSRSEGK